MEILKNLKTNAKLQAFSFFKVPMLFYARPRLVTITKDRLELKIPLARRTKNHLHTMYFGALNIGAEAAVGLLAYQLMDELGAKNINLIFKDFHADFLKRAEGDVHFICEEGKKKKEKKKAALQTGERMNFPVHITAIVPKISKNEAVAKFILTLSLKKK